MHLELAALRQEIVSHVHAPSGCVYAQQCGLEHPSGAPSQEGQLAELHGIPAPGAGQSPPCDVTASSGIVLLPSLWHDDSDVMSQGHFQIELAPSLRGLAILG